MMHSLILDKNDLKYCLLKEIFNIIDSRKTMKIFASKGFKNLKKLRTTVKTMFISMFFELPTKFVVNELKNKKELRRFFNFEEILEADQIFEYFSRNEPQEWVDAINRSLNSLKKPRRGGKKTFIVDATPIDLDFNFYRKKQPKEKLEKLDLKWSYSSSKGFYIGFKATFVFDYKDTMPVAFLLHSGAPNDSKLFEEIMEKLRKSRIIRKGDIIIFDKGYYSYKNYQLGISKYKIVPLIFPKENFKLEKLTDRLTYPLSVFKVNKKVKQEKTLFNNLKKTLVEKIKNWKSFKPIRGKIEDYFKFLKQGLEMRKIHKYTPRSVEKTVVLFVFLGTLIVMQGYTTKTDLQRLSEM